MKYFPYSIIVLLTTLNIFLIVSINNRAQYFLVMQRQEQKLQKKYQSLFNLYVSANDNEYKRLEVENIMLINSNDTTYLKDYIKDKLLVLKINDIGCKACVDSMILLVQKIVIEPDDMIIVGDFKNTNEEFIWKRINNIRCNIFSSENLVIDNKLDDNNIPHMYFVDKSGMLSDVFISDKNATIINDIYLNKVKRKLNTY